MRFQPLEGELEEKALQHSLKHWAQTGARTGREIARAHNGCTGYLVYEGDLTFDNMITRGKVELRVRKKGEPGVTYVKTYKPDDWFTRAKEAGTMHQMDLFEMMGHV